jgi:hypothetical protein
MQNRGRWTLCLNMSCPKKAEKAAKKDAVKGDEVSKKAQKAAKKDAAKGDEVSKKD